MTPRPQPEYIVDDYTLGEIERLLNMPEHAWDDSDYDAKETALRIIRSRPHSTVAPDAATIRNQMLDDAAKDLKTMENTATLRYESATTKNEEVYQQGIVMGLQMAQKSLRTPGHERGDQR